MTNPLRKRAVLPVRFPGRRFQLWSYTVSHAQLLLVSTKDASHPTRCEILFKNVARLDLPTLIAELEIDAVDPREVPPSVLQLGEEEMWDRTVYRVRGRNCLGYVVAGVVVCGEDEGEYYTPSSLIDEPYP
jgi:hypothetical protein